MISSSHTSAAVESNETNPPASTSAWHICLWKQNIEVVAAGSHACCNSLLLPSSYFFSFFSFSFHFHAIAEGAIQTQSGAVHNKHPRGCVCYASQSICLACCSFRPLIHPSILLLLLLLLLLLGLIIVQKKRCKGKQRKGNGGAGRRGLFYSLAFSMSAKSELTGPSPPSDPAGDGGTNS